MSIKNIKESETLKLGQQIKQLQAQGKSVINFAVGELDFETPNEIKEATITALNHNKTRYSSTAGELELRETICKKLKRENALSYTPENILVSNGSKQILYSLFQVLCNPGDEVIIPTPYWISFSEQAKLAGAKPVFVPTKDHQLDVEKLKKAMNKKTKAIVLNSPNNPSGAVYKDIKAVAETAADKGITIISDEAYELITYDNIKYTSTAALSEHIKKHTITVHSFSKIFSMTGFRLGYAAAEKEIITQLSKLQSHMTSNPCTFAQYGAIAAYELNKTFIQKRVSILEKRRNLAYKECTKLFDCVKPQGRKKVSAPTIKGAAKPFSILDILENRPLGRAT